MTYFQLVKVTVDLIHLVTLKEDFTSAEDPRVTLLRLAHVPLEGHLAWRHRREADGQTGSGSVALAQLGDANCEELVTVEGSVAEDGRVADFTVVTEYRKTTL